MRTVKGYESFDELTEVLEMLKGGFGLIDAPQLFTNKVDEVFISYGVRPTCTEPKIYLKLDGSGGRSAPTSSNTSEKTLSVDGVCPHG